MPEVLSRTPEPQQEYRERPEAKRPSSTIHSTSFQYYIHDSVATFRLQLIGELRASNVTELNGSWETARTTLGHRKLVLDLRRLYSADEEGRRWLAKMVAAGGACLPGTCFET